LIGLLELVCLIELDRLISLVAPGEFLENVGVADVIG